MKFKPNSFTYNLIRSLYVLIIMLALILAVIFIKNNTTSFSLWFVIIICIILFLYGLISLVNSLRYYIKIEKNVLSVPDDKIHSKNQRVQYKKSINLSEVKDITIVYSNTNSEFNTIQTLPLSSLSKKKYLEFKTNDNQIKRIWIDMFSNNQIEKILNIIINNNNELNLNTEIIMKSWIK